MRSGQREKQQQYRFVENRDGSFFRPDREEETTLVYGSADYTRINPAMDEHGEINLLLFNGLTAHDADDNIVPGLAENGSMMQKPAPIPSYPGRHSVA